MWEQNSIHLLQQRNAIRILIESVWMLSLCLTTLFSFYEEYDENLLTDEQKSLLRLENYKHPSERKILTNKCICLLSKWPFFDAFEKFLFFIYKRLLMGPFDIPLERYISHFLYRYSESKINNITKKVQCLPLWWSLYYKAEFMSTERRIELLN